MKAVTFIMVGLIVMCAFVGNEKGMALMATFSFGNIVALFYSPNYRKWFFNNGK